MRRVIPLIADRVFPESALPNAPVAAPDHCVGSRLDCRQRFGEPLLDRAQPPRIIAIPIWQRPHAMHMIRQHDPGIDMERMRRANRPHRRPKGIDPRHQQIAPPVPQGDREEIGPARNPNPPIIRHRPPREQAQRRRESLRCPAHHSITTNSHRRAGKRKRLPPSIPPHRTMAGGADAFPPYRWAISGIAQSVIAIGMPLRFLVAWRIAAQSSRSDASLATAITALVMPTGSSKSSILSISS